jgi:signal peptidase I
MPGPVRNSSRVTSIARITVKTAVRAMLVTSVAFLLFVGIGPHVFGYRVVTVLTGSMQPMASPGDLLVDVPVPLSSLRVGDVITFEAPTPDHPVVTHRVIEVVTSGDSPTVRTQGDANDAADPWAATLNGGPAWKVRTVVPSLGTLIRFLRAGHVQAATTRLVPLLLAVFWLVVIWTPGKPEYEAKHFLVPTS